MEEPGHKTQELTFTEDHSAIGANYALGIRSLHWTAAITAL